MRVVFKLDEKLYEFSSGSIYVVTGLPSEARVSYELKNIKTNQVITVAKTTVERGSFVRTR